MNEINNKLIKYTHNDEIFYTFLKEAKQGQFWHWQRTYILRDSNHQIYAIQLNVFERMYGCFVGHGMESFFRKIFASKHISSILLPKEIDIFAYNLFRRVLSKGKEKECLEKIYERIEKQSALWRGNQKIHLKTPNPYLNGSHPRKEWWGRFAYVMQRQGLISTLAKIEMQSHVSKPVALDLGCGNSASTMYLLGKGWKVICIDYSPQVIKLLETRANQINQEWLKTKQLTLVCMNVEDYQWPEKVDLILAGSILSYCNPKKIRTIVSNIYNSLKVGGHFVGNFFCSKYLNKAGQETNREMGAWLIKNEDNVGYLLAGQGYEVIKCEHGGEQSPHSIVFMGKKI